MQIFAMTHQRNAIYFAFIDIKTIITNKLTFTTRCTLWYMCRVNIFHKTRKTNNQQSGRKMSEDAYKPVPKYKYIP